MTTEGTTTKWILNDHNTTKRKGPHNDVMSESKQLKNDFKETQRRGRYELTSRRRCKATTKRERRCTAWAWPHTTWPQWHPLTACLPFIGWVWYKQHLLTDIYIKLFFGYLFAKTYLNIINRTRSLSSTHSFTRSRNTPPPPCLFEFDSCHS